MYTHILSPLANRSLHVLGNILPASLFMQSVSAQAFISGPVPERLRLGVCLFCPWSLSDWD